MSQTHIKADLCVIGAGAAGLSVAAGGARLGAKTVLFEAGEMGGECLNTGCVPSKAILSAAHRVHAIRTSGPLGVTAGEPEIDFSAVMAHVRQSIAAIAPHDSQERFEGMGVQVIRERARFVDEATLESESYRVTAKRFVIATGSRTAVPPIPGIEEAPYLTNETLFDMEAQPASLAILGGGAIGVEMAQAFQRLGTQVSVIELDDILPAAPRELAEGVAAALSADGVRLMPNTQTERIETTPEGVRLILDNGESLEAERLLLATGRQAVLDTLDLDKAGVAVERGALVLSERLRTTNKRIYAAGDAAGGYRLTHAAGWDASVLIRNFYFAMRTKRVDGIIPAAVYTEPEIAWFGEDAAQSGDPKAKDVRQPYSGNDRAIAEGQTDGAIRLTIGKGGKLLGAGVMGHGAGDLIQTPLFAAASGRKAKDLASYVPPYPTRGEQTRWTASAYYEPVVFGKFAKALAGLLRMFQ